MGIRGIQGFDIRPGAFDEVGVSKINLVFPRSPVYFDPINLHIVEDPAGDRDVGADSGIVRGGVKTAERRRRLAAFENGEGNINRLPLAAIAGYDGDLAVVLTWTESRKIDADLDRAFTFAANRR